MANRNANKPSTIESDQNIVMAAQLTIPIAEWVDMKSTCEAAAMPLTCHCSGRAGKFRRCRHMNHNYGGAQMRLTLLLVSLVMFSGCADTHQITRVPGTAGPMSRQASAYVGVPKDGSYASTAYPGSGASTAQAVAAAFAPYLTKVTVGVKTEDFDAALKSAQMGGYTYLLYPEILHWEDRATEWSARPDQASVKVSIVGMDGAVLDSAVVGGKSGLGTFGGDRPEHLLPKPLSDYASTLFRQ